MEFNRVRRFVKEILEKDKASRKAQKQVRASSKLSTDEHNANIRKMHKEGTAKANQRILDKAAVDKQKNEKNKVTSFEELEEKYKGLKSVDY